MVQTNITKKNALHDLGYKIFLDRYALKDMKRETLTVGDTVIVVVDSKTGQREIGKITALDLPKVTIELRDGETVSRDLEHVDKPIETDPAQMMDRVAAGIAHVEPSPAKQKEWENNFRWLLDDWKFVPGGRILTGAGTNQELTYYNCYVVPSPKDSRGGIMDTLTHMTEIMSRGGGVGINISSLRPKHAYVKGVNGRSSGSVSWGALYSFVTGLIEQGGSRRGALMLILNDWHPDVFNFINSKREMGQITNANISVGISDTFMDAVKADGDWDLVFPDTSEPNYDKDWDGELDKWIASGRKVIKYKTIKARELWNAMIESAWASAEPGVWFRERSNKMSNSWYYNPLISTNPCFTGDARIYTNKGLITARELFDDETEIEVVLDGRFGVERTTTLATRVFMTGVKPVFKLETKEGYSIRATADHRIMTSRGWVEMQNLQEGDQVHILNRKGGFGQEGSLRLGRILGWLVGDGTIKQDRAVLSFFGEEKQELAPLFAEYVQDIVDPITVKDRTYTTGVINVAGRDEARVQSFRLRTLVEGYGLVENKHQVPEVVFKGTEDMQRGFLQALFTADGSVQQTTTKGVTIRLASSTLPLLEQIQVLLGNFGIPSRIYKNRRQEGMRSLPDGKGEYKQYLTKAQHELCVTKSSIIDFQREIGFLMGYKNEKLVAKLADSKDKPKPQQFFATVVKTISDGIEEVFDLTEPVTHSVVVNNIVLHQCGEQPLSAWSVCNLGALNLAKFYDTEKKDVAWADLDRAVRYAVRFLDDVIDGTPYFFEENKQTQQSERRVGLGTMGVAELMIYCGVRYGSEESVAFIDKLYKAIAVAAYETSAEIAAEKGSFEHFDAEKVLQSGYMLQMPEDVRQQVREKGLRNVTLLTQAPTGCVAPDTLISTQNGLMPMVNLGDPNGTQWQLMTRDIHTDEGLRKTSHFYVNGYQPVKKVTTKRGFGITATHNHRLRVVDQNGDYVWRRMDEMSVSDKVVMKRGTLTHSQDLPLQSVEQGNRALSELPSTLTPDFAEMLGLYMGDDGYTKKRGGIHLVVAQKDPDLLNHVSELLQNIWGERHIAIEEREGCWIASLNAQYATRFFDANGLRKPEGNHGEGAAGAFIPAKVLEAGKAHVASFLRGLFEADGSVSRGTITLVSTSKTLIDQVQVALLGLGIIATQRAMPQQDNRYGTRALYELQMLNRREAQRFMQEVGFISQRKNALGAALGAMSDRADSIAVPAMLNEFYGVSAGLPNAIRQRIIGLVSNGAMIQHAVRELTEAHPQLAESRLAELVDMDIFLDEVEGIETGMSHTYDISVPSNNTYIANGFVSHNTTGTMVNTSTGIEPFFSWVYYRKSRLGLHEEHVPIVAEWYAQNPGVDKLPEHFITAMELAPEEHVKVQGAFQKWVDSAISKTANVPNEYTVEQVSDLYLMMYDLGCKGGTIYRDGSRNEQVLMLKGDERAESEMEGMKKKEEKSEGLPTTPHKVYPRPVLLNGTTVSFKTPFGTAYITMNNDEHGNPFEVFITVGKAGSDVQADAEAMGRMISLQLRTTAPHNRREMLRLIMEQLEGIGGARPMGFGIKRVLSLPDAMASALRQHYFNEDQPQQLGLPMSIVDTVPLAKVSTPEPHTINGNGVQSGYNKGADMCPECGTISFIRVEGCKKCTTCGYSEC